LAVPQKVTEKVLARAKAVQILKKLPVFDGLVEEEYFRVLSMCSSTVAKKGEVLFKQGDDGSSMFILLSGEVDIIVEGVGVVHTMKSGEILGEIGLVRSEPRTAAAKVKSDSILLHLYADILHEVVKTSPRIGYIIMRNVAIILADRLIQQNNKKSKAAEKRKKSA
jgi:CRP-like cAMP-binding protein